MDELFRERFLVSLPRVVAELCDKAESSREACNGIVVHRSRDFFFLIGFIIIGHEVEGNAVVEENDEFPVPTWLDGLINVICICRLVIKREGFFIGA